ncbi:MAG: NAD(P)H-dependent glycerol-3-phosphate dehydrogenase [Candidatus Woesearchaeota archaeon]
MVKKISIIGCGAFGYAISLLLSRTHKDIDIFIYDVNMEYIEGLKNNRKHPFFYSELIINYNLIPTGNINECLDGTDIVIMAIPAQLMRKASESIKDYIPQNAIILNLAKALEDRTNLRMSQVIKEVLNTKNPVASLSGGMIADDVAHGYPVGAEIGCENDEALHILNKVFKPTTIHVEITNDIACVEFGGAFKNVISIGAGIIDGLGLGVSSKSFFIAQSLKEIEKLAIILGSDYKSFHTSSNSWIGDITTSCFGDTRNRYFGELIGQGSDYEKAVNILDSQRKHAEGLATLKVVKELIDKHHIHAPFINTIYDVVYNKHDARKNFERISLIQNMV